MTTATPTPWQRVHTSTGPRAVPGSQHASSEIAASQGRLALRWHVPTVSLPRDGLTVWVRRTEYMDTPVKAVWHEAAETFGISVVPEGETSPVDVEIPVVEVHSWRYVLEADLPPLAPPTPPPTGEGISLPFALFWGMDEAGAADTKIDSVAGVGLVLQRGTPAIAPGLHGNALSIAGSTGASWEAADEKLAHVHGASWSLILWFQVVAPGQPSAQGGPGFDYLPYDGGVWFRCGATVLAHSARVATESGSDTSDFDPAPGTWHMLHMFYDAGAQRMGWSLDAGAETTWPTAVDMPATAGAGVLDIYNEFTAGGGQVLLDDLGLVAAGRLPAVDITWLYNGGAGREWPINVVTS